MNWFLRAWCWIRREQCWFCYFDCETKTHDGKGRITVRDVGRFDKELVPDYIQKLVEKKIGEEMVKFTITGWAKADD